MAKTTKKEQEIIDAAKKRLDRCIKADEHNRKNATEDLKFANGDQWTEGEKKRRSDAGRPALTFNFLPKFIDQVVGDMLHNTPQVKINPIDSRGDVQIAKIRQGLISNIEYNSNSKAIYGYAARQMVTCGYGAWRVLTRYAEDNPFVQEAYLESIRNPFLTYMDPDAKDQMKADAKYGFIIERLSKDAFKERYPKATVPTDQVRTGAGLKDEHWFDGETVTIAEYFTVEKKEEEMIQLEDGRVVASDEFDELIKEYKSKVAAVKKSLAPPPMPPGMPPQGQAAPMPPQGMPGQAPPMPLQGQAPPMPGKPPMPPQGQPGMPPQGQAPPGMVPPAMLEDMIKAIGPEPKVAKKRITEKPVVRQRIITCYEILEGGAEGNVVAGKYIPIIELRGKELNIEGKNYVYGLIRNAKDPQKMLNFWNTSAAEAINNTPKTPWLGTPKQFENFEKDYATAGVDNMPFLKYNPDPEAPGPPQRQMPAQVPAAVFQMIAQGENNLKSVLGMFNADVGGTVSQQTGEAVRAVQRPGDIGTFEFSENLARAIMYTGKILNEMIPDVYDSERDVRVRKVDESEVFVPINTTVGSALDSISEAPDRYAGLNPQKLHEMLMKEGKDAKFNDITVGKYDVVVTTGPSYATQREESARNLLQLVQAMPQQMAVGADIMVENMDFKGADELATRLRKPLLMQGIVKPKQGEQIPQPPPNPAMINAQVKMQQEQNKAAALQMKVQQEQIKLRERELSLKEKEIQLQLAMLEAQKAARNNGVELQLKGLESQQKYANDARRIDLEERRFNHQIGKDVAEHNHKRDMDYMGLIQSNAEY